MSEYYNKEKTICVIIEQDENVPSPREDDNIGKMVGWHRNYIVGDSHEYNKPEDFQSDMRGKKIVIMPYYAYEHSGIRFSTGRQYPFNCQWDSYQVGWIYADYDTIRKEFGIKNVTKSVIAKVKQILAGEVATFSTWSSGDVWQFRVEKAIECDTCGNVEWEHVDSCGGFYGSYQDSDMAGYLGDYADLVVG